MSSSPTPASIIYFFRIAFHIPFLTFTPTDCCETASFSFAAKKSGKWSERFVMILTQAHNLCSLYTNGDFNYINWFSFTIWFDISRGSLASIRTPSLGCAHCNNRIPAFPVLIFDSTLNFSQLRMNSSHVAWFIPRLSLGLLEVHLEPLHDCSCSTLWRPRRLQTTSLDSSGVW